MYLLFDIGGTNMRLAESSGNKLENITTFQTPQTFKAAVRAFDLALNKSGFNKKHSLSVGGVPRSAAGKLTFWHTHPAVKVISKITKSKVVLENDAALAGLGETWFGSAKGKNIVAYLTFSTGFGGARIVNKKIDSNYFGFEPDYQIADYNHKNGSSSPLRLFVSGRGIKSRLHVRPEDIRDRKTLNEIEGWMKIAVNNAAVFWSPEVIVIGGGIGADPTFSANRIQSYLNDRLKKLPRRPKILKAKLGQHSGLWGALALAKQNK
jgi:predicted NBD/HSP70 family sugar kinase